MSLLLISGVLCVGCVAYLLDLTSITISTVGGAIDRYRRVKSLYNIVSNIDGISFKKSVFITAQILSKTIYYKFFQVLHKNVDKKSKHLYEVKFVINGVLYKQLVNVKRGPKDILQIIDETQSDVTDDVSPFMGPNEDMYINPLTPSDLGYQKLIFVTKEDGEKVFETNELLLYR